LTLPCLAHISNVRGSTRRYWAASEAVSQTESAMVMPLRTPFVFALAVIDPGLKFLLLLIGSLRLSVARPTLKKLQPPLVEVHRQGTKPTVAVLADNQLLLLGDGPPIVADR
jgi:hypothetical protein